jgi:hypothetical protein
MREERGREYTETFTLSPVSPIDGEKKISAPLVGRRFAAGERGLR